MATQQTGSQQGKGRTGVFPRWTRPVIIMLVIVFFVVAGVIWIWKIWGDISSMMTAIFAVPGVIFTFLSLPFLYTSHEEPEADHSSSTKAGGVVAPQVDTTVTLSQQTQVANVLPPTVPVNWPAVPDEHIFLFNEKLTNKDDFFGRSSELRNLIGRTKNGSSTSLTGPRRIGKTWLMTYLTLVAPAQLGPNYRVGLLDASLPTCGSITGFTLAALEALDLPVFGDSNALKLTTLQIAVKELIAKKVTPVLCIDEFERLGSGQEFDLDFFAGLRAITQVGLCVVTASQHPLIEMVSQSVQTSPFFNVFEQYTLTPFGPKSAKDFVEIKGIQAGFSVQERSYMLEYGKTTDKEWPPLRLQLVGKMLLEDKLAAQEEPDSYRPDNPGYWREFEKRLNSKYKAVVGP